MNPSSCGSSVTHGLKRMRAFLWQWRKVELTVAVLIAVFLIAAEIRPPCLWPYLLFKRFPKLNTLDRRDVTLVTAYLQLGHFEKNGQTFSLYKYLHWAQVYQYVQNPLVVFTDSEQLETLILETRKHLTNRTKVIRVSRSKLKSFQDVEEVRRIFSDPSYPKYHPNTVIAEYPCVQHAKYELMRMVLEAQYFASTKYIAWIDIGYFRYLTERRRKFYVVAPPNMDEDKIAMTEVKWPDWSLYPNDVFRGNLVWVGGGMSLATRGVYRQFTDDYNMSSRLFLQQGLSNTDQQVIYSMYTNVHALAYKTRSKIQTYSWFLDDIRDCWFYLGYLCYREVD